MLNSGAIIQLLLVYRYVIFFPLVVIEGPIVMMIAGLLSSTGQMNFWIAYTVAVFGDISGDLIYYAIGRFGGTRVFNWFRGRSEVSGKRIENIEKLFEKHSFKTLFLGKITHAIGWVVLFSAGAAEMPFWKFILYTFLPTIPKTLALMLVGYYFGQAYLAVNKYLGYFSVVVLGLFILVAIFLYFFPKKMEDTIMEDDGE